MIKSNIIELRSEFGSPKASTINKVKAFLSEEVKAFIKMAPFAVLSSSDSDGNCDASPRGGRPGFIKVIDDQTLLIPDIRGNRLFQSFGNFETNPKAALLFLLPGSDRTVRVNGRVSVFDKTELENKGQELEVFYKDEKSELIQGFILHVDEAYTHCPRALKFSDLWNPDSIKSNQ